GARLITQAELLGNAGDIDSGSLTATGLALTSGSGSLTDNHDGTWTYTPAADDDGSVSFTYSVSDGSLTAAGSATLDITPVNDAPTTSAVTLSPITEDSGARLITQAELLAHAGDIDSGSLSASNLAITSGAGSLTDNGDGTWSYTPAADDDGAVSFSYSVSDGSLTAAGSATLDITPVNDAPTTSAVTLSPITEDSGARLITQAELLGNAGDIDSGSLTATGLALTSGAGSLTDNGDGTWSYTPAANDDGSVSFTYSVSDGSLTAAGSATLDITPVNDAPTTSAVTLAAIAEDSGARLITQAELLGNAADIDSGSLTASNLAITSGAGSLVDNHDGTWSYTPAANDDSAVSFTYSVSDGSLTAAGSATLDITPVNDAPVLAASTASTTTSQDTSVTGRAPAATDIDGDALVYELATAPGHGSATMAADGSYTYTPAAGFSGNDRFQARVADGHGGQMTIWIDVMVLPAPTLALAAPSDLGVSNTDQVTSAPVITLEGSTQPNQTLHLYSPQGVLLASVTADAAGRWTADGIDLIALQGDNANAAAGAPGAYTFVVRPVLNGQEGAAARLTVIREVITPTPQSITNAPVPEVSAAPVVETAPTPAAAVQPAFDSALVPRGGAGEALPLAPVQITPVRDTTSAPAPRTTTEGDIYTRPSGFQIMVTPSGEPSLKLFRGVDDQMIPLGRSVAVQIPADAFVHSVLAETVTLYATQADGTPLPRWLSFDGKSGKFVGEPPAGLAQDVAIRVTARDSQGREATTMFRLTVKDGSTNSRATLTQQLARGEAWAFKPGQRVWQAQPRPLARHG
ncbi:MAG: hypothetical protein RLY71_3333, partial [Pseudomonadota bacterium]